MVKLSELATTDQVLAEQLEDPQFAKEWDRTAFARAVAERILVYRTEKGLTQTQLARQVGTVRSVIAVWKAASRLPHLPPWRDCHTGSGSSSTLTSPRTMLN
jgi:DNA-binding XRE family transcriptional regulator